MAINTMTKRADRLLSARSAIGELEAQSDLFILTYGRFSLIDALVTILEQTGPADVRMSVWTVGKHYKFIPDLMKAGMIKSLQALFNVSIRRVRVKDYPKVVECIGDANIRCVLNHAKFMLIDSGTWKVVVRMSMNLNENPRMETFEISTDDVLFEFLSTVFRGVFEEVPVGKNYTSFLDLIDLEETHPFSPIRLRWLEREDLKDVRTTHIAGRALGRGFRAMSPIDSDGDC